MVLTLLLLGVQASACGGQRSAVSPHPLATALNDPTFSGPGASVAFARTRAAGAKLVRFPIDWRAVAPPGAVRPAGFDAADPADPAYRWDAVDREVRLARAKGLQPIVYIQDAPLWAQARAPRLRKLRRWMTGRQNFLGNWMVSPRALAAFSSAAAKRYGGRFDGLPRVRYWQVWNEPNLGVFLNPQLSTQLRKAPSVPFDPGEVVSPNHYRDMVNAFAAAVHAVHRDNTVVAGGLAPFSGAGGVITVGAYLFMRKVLCLSEGAVPKPTCDDPVHFDVWSTHPYTSGGPTHQARLADDISLGDLPRANRLLEAAVKAGHVVSRRPVQFWVTEFGWDTSPPDPWAVPLDLHARWVAEALYRMWTSGVSLVAWFGIRDQATNGRPHSSVIESGLYFRGKTIARDRPKPALTAFRFPFVAFRSPQGVLVWGRTPSGKREQVVVDQSWKGRWTRRAELQTDRFGIFEKTLSVSGPASSLRARLVDGSTRSLPFSLKRPPDRPVNPFGGPPPLRVAPRRLSR